jgi:hypothetical protein
MISPAADGLALASAVYIEVNIPSLADLIDAHHLPPYAII